MSQWITDRRPTEEDGPMVYGPDGKVCHYKNISGSLQPWIRRAPWKPIPPCEPYVKPKKYKATLNLDGEPIVLEIATGTTWAAAKTREAAERIAAIYEETEPDDTVR